MASLKVNEIYESVQGEGPNTGVPTTFVRFGGCNLRCPGWGRGRLPDGTWVDGCDTVHAVYPEWRHTWKDMSASDILTEIKTPYVCLTGGEPLIQPAGLLNTLGSMLINKGIIIEMFTNGSKVVPGWLLQAKSFIIMDFKLPGSGEFGSFNNLNLELLRPQDTIKFVCKDEEDVDEAMRQMVYMQRMTKASFSMGVTWDGEILEGEMAEIIAGMGVSDISLNIQMHKHIWDPNERRR